MNAFWIVVIILIALALFGAPGLGPWQHSYGWTPSGIVGVVAVVLLILLLTGKL